MKALQAAQAKYEASVAKDVANGADPADFKSWEHFIGSFKLMQQRQPVNMAGFVALGKAYMPEEGFTDEEWTAIGEAAGVDDDGLGVSGEVQLEISQA